jgi:hypothetical protein
MLYKLEPNEDLHKDCKLTSYCEMGLTCKRCDITYCEILKMQDMYGIDPQDILTFSRKTGNMNTLLLVPNFIETNFEATNPNREKIEICTMCFVKEKEKYKVYGLIDGKTINAWTI